MAGFFPKCEKDQNFFFFLIEDSVLKYFDDFTFNLEFCLGQS